MAWLSGKKGVRGGGEGEGRGKGIYQTRRERESGCGGVVRILLK